VRIVAISSSGGSSTLFDVGTTEASHLVQALLLASMAKCATPLRLACVIAPPSSSWETFSCVTALTTSGR